MGKLNIEVVYALPNKQTLLSCKVDEGTCVKEAIIHSGMLTLYPEINLETCQVGIFSKLTTYDQ